MTTKLKQKLLNVTTSATWDAENGNLTVTSGMDKSKRSLKLELGDKSVTAEWDGSKPHDISSTFPVEVTIDNEPSVRLEYRNKRLYEFGQKNTWSHPGLKDFGSAMLSLATENTTEDNVSIIYLSWSDIGDAIGDALGAIGDFVKCVGDKAGTGAGVGGGLGAAGGAVAGGVAGAVSAGGIGAAVGGALGGAFGVGYCGADALVD